MLTELFVANLASTIVTAGGMTVPSPGTTETFIVSESDGSFPIVRHGQEQFHFKDSDPDYGSEIMCCIETDENRWLVVRGAEGSTPIAHTRKFHVRGVITSEFLSRLGDGSTTELVNASTVFGADRTGEADASDSLMSALAAGPVYLPSGTYRLAKPLAILPGDVLFSFGRVVIRPDSSLTGLAAIEIADSVEPIRLENFTLNGSLLGAGTSLTGIFARLSNSLELRNIRIFGFPGNGLVGSGSDWMIDRVQCRSNFGNGFVLELADSLLFGCRAIGNRECGFDVGDTPLISCYARNNGVDYRKVK